MSIKLLKKLVKHEIKRFYVKNNLDNKKLLFKSEGEIKINIHNENFCSVTLKLQNKHLFFDIDKNVSHKKIKYLALLYYIQELLEDF